MSVLMGWVWGERHFGKVLTGHKEEPRIGRIKALAGRTWRREQTAEVVRDDTGESSVRSAHGDRRVAADQGDSTESKPESVMKQPGDVGCGSERHGGLCVVTARS